MHFTEEKEAEVKAWVVKRLEDISDADSDVLADYVLALIQSEAPDDEIKKLSIESLEDFLKENTAEFVDEVFDRYGPPKPVSAPPERNVTQSAIPVAPLVDRSSLSQPSTFTGGPTGEPLPGQSGFEDTLGSNYSRKRTFDEGPQSVDGQDGHYNRSDRSFKAARGRRGGGRGDRIGNGWDSRSNLNLNPSTGPGQFPGMPPFSQGGFMPFDPNDPMATMMALQQMGFPPMPGMPQMPSGKPTIPQRCHDYDTKGVCILGSACPYQHVNDIAMTDENEYDPATANIVTDYKTSNGPPRGAPRGRGRGRGHGDHALRRGRSEYSQIGPNEDRTITTIVVEQIPEENFYEEAVRDFFSEFGKVEEITLKPQRRLALVKYDSYAAAKRAWGSPKVIFDNRFVKVYWYKPEKDEGDANGKQMPAATKPAEPDFNREEFEQRQAEAQRVHEEKMQKRRETEDAVAELERKKEELAKRQQEEQARLCEKLIGGSTLQDSADGTKADDNVSEQTKALRAQLAALEAEAKSIGIDTTLPSRGRGGFRGRGRGFGPRGRGGYDPSFRGGFRGRGGRVGGVLRLDNRPKRIAVSGVEFTPQRDEALRLFLVGIGEYESLDPNPARKDSVIVSFRDRFVAEKLMYGTSDIPSVGKVEFAWVAGPTPLTATATSSQALVPSGEIRSKEEGSDVTMGGLGVAENEPENENRNGNEPNAQDREQVQQAMKREVDYDVAEEDTW